MVASGEGKSGTDAGVEARERAALLLDAVRRASGRGAVRTLLRAGVPMVGAVLLGLAALVASQAAAPTHVLADDSPSGVPVMPGGSDDQFGIGRGMQAEEQSASAPGAASASSSGLLASLGLLPAEHSSPPPAATAATPEPPAGGLSLAPVVDSVAALAAPAPAPSGGPTLGALLGLSGGDSAGAPPSTVGGLLQGVSSLLLPSPPVGAAAPVVDPRVADPTTAAPATPLRDAVPAVHEPPAGGADSGPVATALNHAPTPPPLAPTPQPTGPQPPAGGSLGANPIPGLGMAVAAFLFAALLLAMASRRPRFTTPVWESVRIVALIERPG